MRLIDAAALESAFEKERAMLIEEKRFGAEHILVHHAMRLIDDAPTVEAAPVVHGRWQERHVDYASDCAIDEVQTAKCSACGLYHTTPYLYSFTDFKYCPYCGADMRESNNG